MGVYIKGMEMPRACVYRENGHMITCPLYDIDGYCGALNTEAIHKENGKLSDCPLIPAADVRPVVRGKWIKTKEQEAKPFTRIIWKCSVCGIEVINTEPVYRIDDWHFCPNCGADMREES